MAKKALCVGINNFKNYSDNSLNGCINDAYDMEDLLINYMGFEKKDVVKLIDKEATKSNIMENLKEMVEGAKSGKYDSLAFSMSSHGTQMLGTEEPDMFDEAFCPYDLDAEGDAWDPDRIIVYDELHDLFLEIPENVALEVYLDTSYIGTGLKEMESIPDREPRYIPPPTMEVSEVKVSKRFKPPLLAQDFSKHILWTACKPGQTCADVNLGGEWHGAFTYYLYEEMHASEKKLSRGEILKKVVEDLKANGYSQTPQLECDATTKDMKFQ